MARNLLGIAALALALGIPALAPVPAAAQANTDNTGYIDGLTATKHLPAGHVKALAGSRVLDTMGRSSGTVKDVIVGAGNQVESIIVATDDRREIRIGVAETMVTQNPATKDYVLLLGVSRDQLAQMPNAR